MTIEEVRIHLPPKLKSTNYSHNKYKIKQRRTKTTNYNIISYSNNGEIMDKL